MSIKKVVRKLHFRAYLLHFKIEEGSIDNAYLDNFDNGDFEKFVKIVKNRKKFIEILLNL